MTNGDGANANVPDGPLARKTKTRSRRPSPPASFFEHSAASLIFFSRLVKHSRLRFHMKRYAVVGDGKTKASVALFMNYPADFDTPTTATS